MWYVQQLVLTKQGGCAPEMLFLFCVFLFWGGVGVVAVGAGEIGEVGKA